MRLLNPVVEDSHPESALALARNLSNKVCETLLDGSVIEPPRRSAKTSINTKFFSRVISSSILNGLPYSITGQIKPWDGSSSRLATLKPAHNDLKR